MEKNTEVKLKHFIEVITSVLKLFNTWVQCNNLNEVITFYSVLM